MVSRINQFKMVIKVKLVIWVKEGQIGHGPGYESGHIRQQVNYQI